MHVCSRCDSPRVTLREHASHYSVKCAECGHVVPDSVSQIQAHYSGVASICRCGSCYCCWRAREGRRIRQTQEEE